MKRVMVKTIALLYLSEVELTRRGSLPKKRQIQARREHRGCIISLNKRLKWWLGFPLFLILLLRIFLSLRHLKQSVQNKGTHRKGILRGATSIMMILSLRLWYNFKFESHLRIFECALQATSCLTTRPTRTTRKKSIIWSISFQSLMALRLLRVKVTTKLEA